MKSIWVGIKRGTLLATGLRAYATDPDLRQEWMMVEKVNKMRLAEYIEAMSGVKVSLDAMFDVQTKRIHEYKKHLLNILGIIHRYDSIEMDDRRWQDLEIDCLVKVFEKVGMEWVLLDVPFVCKSWYKATLNPSCWQCLIFPDNERTEVWPWDDFECPDFQNLMDRFASEFQIDGDRFSVTTFLKFVINRSTGTAVLLKLPKCCTVETFEFAANVCPGLVTSGLPLRLLESEHTNPELIGNWKNLEVVSLGSSPNLVIILALIKTHRKNFYGLDLSMTLIREREA